MTFYVLKNRAENFVGRGGDTVVREATGAKKWETPEEADDWLDEHFDKFRGFAPAKVVTQ